MKTLEESTKLIKMMEQIDKYCSMLRGLQQYGDSIFVEYGRKYAKVLRGRVVHSFVDLSNGDILMAASYAAPAKHARGNIFADDYGRSGVSEYGANYIIK